MLTLSLRTVSNDTMRTNPTLVFLTSLTQHFLASAATHVLRRSGFHQSGH